MALFTEKELAWGFNEWNRRYIEDPEGFAHQWQTVMEFLDTDTGDNNDSDVGKRQAAYIVSLISE